MGGILKAGKPLANGSTYRHEFICFSTAGVKIILFTLEAPCNKKRIEKGERRNKYENMKEIAVGKKL